MKRPLPARSRLTLRTPWSGRVPMLGRRLLAALLLAFPGVSIATTVSIQTVLGEIRVELFDRTTPLTVANFLSYVNSGAYNNSFFHRSVSGFIIQGGGFKDTFAAIPSSPPVINEFGASNLRGTLAMAKLGGDPNSATNQWFINLGNNAANLDAQNGGFTVFGQVIGNGMQVVDAIAALSRVNAGGAFTDLPLVSQPTDNVVRRANLALVNTISVLPNTPQNLAAGWNLIGNGTDVPIYLPASFGDANKVLSVWKWLTASGKWAFYSPLLTGQALTDFAVGKGYEVMSSVTGGEGFWVNTKQGFVAQIPTGTTLQSAALAASGNRPLAVGWSLVAVGDNPTPAAFNARLSGLATAPANPADTPLNLTSLWAWDSTRLGWYFYAPSLDKNGTLQSYIASKAYLDFGVGVLSPTTGFWINKP